MKHAKKGRERGKGKENFSQGVGRTVISGGWDQICRSSRRDGAKAGQDLVTLAELSCRRLKRASFMLQEPEKNLSFFQLFFSVLLPGGEITKEEGEREREVK